jgi:glycosyltransferase involved in cell wall biosynthesis
MPNGKPWPQISIVTPNHNYGHFIEETIRSVLLQGYPNLEYVVTDGSSKDNSLEIIQKYAPWLAHWESSKDRGQTDAISKGLKHCTGDLFNWVNSDDQLLPGALATLGRLYAECEADWIIGGTVIATAETYAIGQTWIPVIPKNAFELIREGQRGLKIGQTAAFVRLKTFREVGGLREGMHFCFDLVFYVEMMLKRKENLRVRTTQQLLARQLDHPASKTSSSFRSFEKEASEIYPQLFRQLGLCDRLRAHRCLQRMEIASQVSDILNSGGSRFPALVRLALVRPAVLTTRYYWGGMRGTVFNGRTFSN